MKVIIFLFVFQILLQNIGFITLGTAFYKYYIAQFNKAPIQPNNIIAQSPLESKISYPNIELQNKSSINFSPHHSSPTQITIVSSLSNIMDNQLNFHNTQNTKDQSDYGICQFVIVPGTNIYTCGNCKNSVHINCYMEYAKKIMRENVFIVDTNIILFLNKKNEIIKFYQITTIIEMHYEMYYNKE